MNTLVGCRIECFDISISQYIEIRYQAYMVLNALIEISNFDISKYRPLIYQNVEISNFDTSKFRTLIYRYIEISNFYMSKIDISKWRPLIY